MSLTDTHCHIHEPSYPDADGALIRAREAGVVQLICVGTDVTTSRQAVTFASDRPDVYASIGIHPHETANQSVTQGKGSDALRSLLEGHKDISSRKIVAIGEIGLDYHYMHSPREAQLPLLEEQLQVAVDYDLPVIFHVRTAFDDFWPIFTNFHYDSHRSRPLRGVLHSFTDTSETLQKALENDLFIGVNGISTFTKDPKQQAMFASIPLNKLLLETDSPFLTPPPFRGTINQPAYVSLVASYHAEVRGISEEKIASTTTANAENLFGLIP